MRNILRSFEQIAARRARLMDNGRRLVAQLNEVLPSMGYRVVPTGEGAPAAEASARPRRMSGVGGRRLKCPECPRTFSQPMNLGRHLSATHKIRRRSRGAQASGRRRAA